MRTIAAAAGLIAPLVPFASGQEPPLSAPAECFSDGAPDAGSIDHYDALILRHAQKRGLNPRLVKAVIATESQFSPRAVSPRGARGLMQLMPATSRELGVPVETLGDPDANIGAGTEYLARLFRAARRRGEEADPAARARTLRRVIAAYHAGPRVLASPDWPDSTRRYVRSVLSCYGSRASVLRPSGPARADAREVAWTSRFEP